mgnify:CR=1 FL=1
MVYVTRPNAVDQDLKSPFSTLSRDSRKWTNNFQKLSPQLFCHSIYINHAYEKHYIT